MIIFDCGLVAPEAYHVRQWVHVIIFPLVLISHVGLFLAGQWSIPVRSFVGYHRALPKNKFGQRLKSHNSSHRWTHCLVIPPNPVALTRINTKNNNKSTFKSPSTGATVGSTEITPIRIDNDHTYDLHNNAHNRNENNETNATNSRVLTISYEQIVFRCCILTTHGPQTDYIIQPGGDIQMDAIWETSINRDMDNLPCKLTTPSIIAPGNNVMERGNQQYNDQHQTSTSQVQPSSSPSIFHRIHYPIDLPISFYTTHWKGHTTITSLLSTRKIYSNNSLHITITQFKTLLTQQLLAPFFLFQLFCVLLWSMDEFYIYAIFTLFTLVMFECTVAFTRLKDLKRLRETLRPPYSLWTWRNNMWKVSSSDELVVGDILSLTSIVNTKSMHNSHNRNEGGLHVPADILLLRGGAVVNEAMLTGESVPQVKETIDVVASASMDTIDDTVDTLNTNNVPTGGTAARNEPRLDIEDSNYKRAILFGGTLLVNHSSASDDETDDHDSALEGETSSGHIPPPPDKGCIGVILRTGFETQQGSLLRTMVHTSTKSQNDGVNTKDTFLFIVILLLCAIGSSILILHHGWNDPTRNRFKLVLHVVIIITSVVPPELPMELSLAVTTSLADLIRRCSVYCTEPFRIPLAGMVDTCAFDKTGTLTSDQMVLRGVRLPLSPVSKGTNLNVEMADELILPHYDGVSDDGNANIIGGVLTGPVPIEVLRVMVACHSLALNFTGDKFKPDNIIGDPLEKAVLTGCKCTLLSNSLVALPHRQGHTAQTFNIHHRFAFTSKLKRMTVLASDLGCKKVWVLTKGAPETIKALLKPSSIPASYDAVSRHHMSLGQRVLAMGYRKLDSKLNLTAWKKRGRQTLECDLIFAGFFILDCPLKPDSKRIITELRASGHDTVMITGDAVLTAAEVARQVGIIDSQKGEATYELRERVNKNLSNVVSTVATFEFVPITCADDNDFDTEKSIAYSQNNLSIVQNMLNSSEISAICVTGDVLAKFSMEAVRLEAKKNGTELPYIDPKTVLLHPNAQASLQTLVPLISIFARHAPRQKEAVIAAFNGAGRVTLMCGDGTNDVGALKMSHVGISIISVPSLETKQMKAMKGMEKVREEERSERKKKKKSVNSGFDDKANKRKLKKNRKKTFEEHLAVLAETEEELCNVALGDASVASPFTSRTTSIKCTKDILQRGRCTLVTMIQIYKILGVNCLVNALVLSSLHIAGAKQGDRQLTVVGLVVAALFFFVTKGRPLEKLSPERPPSSVLCKQVVISIIMQFTIHFVCIMFVTALSKLHLDPYDPSLIPDGQFNPNTLNTATFLMTVVTMVNTFLVNYRGHPFVEDLRDNKLLLRSLKVCYAVLFVCALELFPPINELLQLTPLPQGDDRTADLMSEILRENPQYEMLQQFEPFGFKTTLVTMMVIDSVASYYAERGLLHLFDSSRLDSSC